MSRPDDDLKRDLTDAFDGKYDREELIARVTDRIVEDGGGEHEISVAPVRLSGHPAVWAAFVAAAAAILVLTFLVTRPTGGGGAEGETLAGGGGERQPAPLIIEIKEEAHVVEGKEFTLAALKTELEKRAARTRETPDGPSELSVLIRAPKGTPWRRVQVVMQACADPAVRIYKLQFASGKQMFLPRKVVVPEKPCRSLCVTAAWPGASPEKMESEVARRIEGAVLTVPGIREVDTECGKGRCEVNIVLQPGLAAEEPARNIRRILKRIESHLPEGVGGIRVEEGPEIFYEPLDPLSEEVKPEIEERKPVEQGPDGERPIKDAKVSDHNEVEDGPPTKPAPAAPMRVHARLRVHEKKVQLNVGNPRLGGHWYALDKGLEMLGPFLATCRKQSDEIEAVLEAAGDVPHDVVVKLIDALMKSGVTDITFRGTPPR